MDYLTVWKEREKKDEEERLKLFHDARKAAELAARILVDKFRAERVYLFGSLLDEDSFSTHSDIDIAVDGLRVESYFTALNHLWDILPKGTNLDLVPLEDADETLKAKILISGIILNDKQSSHS